MCIQGTRTVGFYILVSVILSLLGCKLPAAPQIGWGRSKPPSIVLDRITLHHSVHPGSWETTEGPWSRCTHTDMIHKPYVSLCCLENSLYTICQSRLGQVMPCNVLQISVASDEGLSLPRMTCSSLVSAESLLSHLYTGIQADGAADPLECCPAPLPNNTRILETSAHISFTKVCRWNRSEFNPTMCMKE